MSQRVTSKRRKKKRIKRNKRRADNAFKFRQENPIAFLDEYRKRRDKFKERMENMAKETGVSECWICDRETIDGQCEDCTKALCSPLTGWTENQ